MQYRINRYRVEVEVTIRKFVWVEARSEQEAMKLAETRVRNGVSDCEIDTTVRALKARFTQTVWK